MTLCPECKEPPHYHSWCTLCAQLFMARPEPVEKPPRNSRWRDRVAELVAVYSEGPTHAQAAARLGASKMAAVGAYHRYVKTRPPMDVAVRQAYESGWTIQETAMRLGCKSDTVRSWADKLGLPKFRRKPNGRQPFYSTL